jgi:hypothetical protein
MGTYLLTIKKKLKDTKSLNVVPMWNAGYPYSGELGWNLPWYAGYGEKAFSWLSSVPPGFGIV